MTTIAPIEKFFKQIKLHDYKLNVKYFLQEFTNCKYLN